MRSVRVGVLTVLCVCFVFPNSALAQDAQKDQPCSDPEFSQFDFWVGDWRVTDEAGTLQGTNRVEKVLNGCAVQENWIGAQGTRGHGYKIFAKRRGIWHQTWVDSNGTLLLLDGRFKDGRMVLKGQTPAREGKCTVEHEILWQALSDGRVRQAWRISRDRGKTWIDAFVGLYTRVE